MASKLNRKKTLRMFSAPDSRVILRREMKNVNNARRFSFVENYVHDPHMSLLTETTMQSSATSKPPWLAA
jgi:hypothetical protein